MKILYGKSSDIPDFWLVMGPIFADRSVAKELGDNIWDNGKIIWILGVEDSGILLGFCCVEDMKNRCLFRHSYVVSSRRGMGYFRWIEQFRDDLVDRIFSEKIKETVVKTKYEERMIKRGWELAYRRGSWSVMRK